MPVARAERGWSPRGQRGAALAASIGALALGAVAAGCGDSSSKTEEPQMLKPGTLTVELVAQPATAGAAPAGFHRELIDDVATRLELKVVYKEAGPGDFANGLVKQRADAATPAPVVDPPSGPLESSAPYFEAGPDHTLYGLTVLRGPDPGKKSPLLEDLDEALSVMKDDGTLQKIYDKWFPGTEVPDAVLNDATG